jgi:hypothetical protein
MIRLGLALLFASGAACAAPVWVARSDAYIRPVLKDTGQYQPEESTELGDESFDTQVADFKPRVYERAQEKDAKVRQDLDILIDSRDKAVATMKLEHRSCSTTRTSENWCTAACVPCSIRRSIRAA